MNLGRWVSILLTGVALGLITYNFRTTVPAKPAVHTAVPAKLAAATSTAPSSQAARTELEKFQKDYSAFYQTLFSAYRAAGGNTLSILGEIVSYAGELATWADDLWPLASLAQTAQDPSASSKIFLGWSGKIQNTIEMRIYFLQRMRDKPGVAAHAAEFAQDQLDFTESFQQILRDFERLIRRAGEKAS